MNAKSEYESECKRLSKFRHFTRKPGSNRCTPQVPMNGGRRTAEKLNERHPFSSTKLSAACHYVLGSNYGLLAVRLLDPEFADST